MRAYDTGMRQLPDVHAFDGDMPGRIADALASTGACRLLGFPGEPVRTRLRTEALALAADGRLQPASMGSARTRAGTLRGDSTCWLDDPACHEGPAFLRELGQLAVDLRETLRIPLHTVEAHYALYPAGAVYVRHRDRLRDDGARLVSFVGYLNPGWTLEDGGALRLYLDAGSVDVVPEDGTAVCFLSDIEHEVLPATRARLSIAAWLRRD